MPKRLGFINEKFDRLKNNSSYCYELVFTEEIEDFWSENFGEKPCSVINDFSFEDSCSYEVVEVLTNVQLGLIKDSSCFSFQDSMDGIASMAWCYDDLGNFLFKLDYGEDSVSVLSKISKIEASLV